MIAAGDDIHTCGKYLLGGLASDPRSSGRVLAIGHHHINRMLPAQEWHEVTNGAPPGLPNDVAYKKQFHSANLSDRRTPGKRLLRHSQSAVMGPWRC